MSTILKMAMQATASSRKTESMLLPWNKHNPREQGLIKNIPKYVDLLKKNRPTLREIIQPADLWTYLKAYDVLDTTIENTLKNNSTPEETVGKLLEHIERGQSWRLHALFRACVLTHQEQVISTLNFSPDVYKGPYQPEKEMVEPPPPPPSLLRQPPSGSTQTNLSQKPKKEHPEKNETESIQSSDTFVHQGGRQKGQTGTDSSQMRKGEQFKRGLRTPSLTKYIKGILEQYPDDGQILKELIQNADDAGAKTVRFVLDEGHYESSPEGLIHPDMEKFQGPALLVYNDGVFTDDDWDGICRMEESIKEKDVIQTGRFGLGFKSIFHVTDLPIILSGDYVGIIDPHQKYLPEKESAWNWHLGDDKDFLQTKEEQFRPLFKRIFGLGAEFLTDRYNHTAFRFPLRREANQLSANIYNAEKVLQLLHSLELDEGQSLLFLKSIQCIEVYQQSDALTETKLRYRMKIAEKTVKQVSEKRQSFLNRVSNWEWRTKPVETILSMTVEAEHFQTDHSVNAHDWLVYHSCYGDKAVTKAADELNVLPWVGIALPLSKSRDLNEQFFESAGHLFATLPLPLDGTERTGLGFHIHAYFAMEQNRRHLRWPTPDQNQEQLNSIQLRWNQLLVNKCIPEAIVTLFRQAIHGVDSKVIYPEKLYELMPNEDSVDAKWKPVVSHIYKELFTGNCLYSPVKGNGWLKVENTIQSDRHQSRNVNNLLEEILLEAGFPLSKIPPHVQAALTKYSSRQPNTITSTDVHNATVQITKKGSTLERDDALMLLQYFLENGQPEDLIGLPLLPLLSGEMILIKDTTAQDSIFLSSKEHSEALLPGLEERLIDINLHDQLLDSFKKLAQTGETQLKQLTFKDVLENLPHILPTSWAGADIVSRSPDDKVHPSLTWLEQIWDYIHLNSPNAHEWKLIEKLPLLPIDGGQTLCKFSLGKKIILGKSGENVLPEEVSEFLSEVGCIILNECPNFVNRHKALLHHSVNLPTCEGIINALVSVSSQNSEVFIGKVKQFASCRKSSLTEFISYISDSGIRLLSPSSKKFLLNLPLFFSVNQSGFQPSRNVSINEVNLTGPSIQIPVPFPVQVIDASEERVQYLLKALNVSKYYHDGFSDVVKEALLPAMKSRKYSNEQVDELLCHIMDHNAKVLLENTDIANDISELAFVETGLMKRQTPKELYDPRDPLLVHLLDKGFFPHQKYHTRDRLACLEKLGMRPVKQITPEVFLQIANSLSRDPGRADTFIELTKTLTVQSVHGKWWEKLKDVAFLRVIREKTDGYPSGLPWKGSADELLTPKDVCHIRFAKQAGSTVPLVDLDEEILALLNGKSSPNLNDIVLQLKLITDHYNPRQKNRYLALLDEVYHGLAKFSEGEIQAALGRHSLSAWIWSEYGFQSTGQILLQDKGIDLSPYYHSLSPELEIHKDLFYRCGVPKSIRLEEVLEVIAAKHMEEDKSKSTVAHDLQLAVKLLEAISKQGTKSALVPIETYDARKLRFMPALECTAWDGSSEFDKDLFYVHSSVSKEVIMHFSIPTVMHRVLDGEEFNITLESFGQNEPLTTRLHSVLEGYTDGLSVLKEMIQNADDAGATEVRLIYDKRVHKDQRKSLLDPGMAEWQGPSIWIYNNATFTDEDFDNITKLNGATKKDKKEQIGAFGLGFNAVYNLTDVPSILSHDTMAIFDPHTTYLGSAVRDKSKPGLRIKLDRQQGRLLSKYPDQFAPWNGICGCNLKPNSKGTTFNGTLFRLPLRGHIQSENSDISKIVYDERNVLELLKMIQREGNNMLLFTQNVLKVSVALIPGEEKRTDEYVRDLFKIHKEPVQYLRAHSIQCDISCPSQKENVRTQKFINECSILKASVSSNKRDERKAANSSMIIKSVVEMSEQGKLLLGETLSQCKSNMYWIVAQCFEHRASIPDINSKQQFVAGIAICLEKDNGVFKLQDQESSGDSPKGSYFSFLPLPVKSPLPFHINGTFILDQSRRHLVQKTDHDKNLASGAWNKALMEGPVCTAYLTALSDIISLTPKDQDLTAILPVSIKDNLITSMSEMFWKRHIQDPTLLEIFPSDNGKVSIHDTYFLDKNFCQGIENNVIDVIQTMFQGSKKTLVSLPMSLEQTLREVDSKMLKSKMITEEVFFTDYFLPNISSLPLEKGDRDSLLVRGLKSTSGVVESVLRSKACIPMSPDGDKLAHLNTLIHPKGKAAGLYSLDDAKFPHINGNSGADCHIILERLCQLGMVRDHMSWDDILEYSRELASVGPQSNIKRVQAFLDYLKWKLVDQKDEIPDGIQQRLQTERFLPSVEKPDDWNLTWKAEEFGSYSGSELYDVKEPLLACTQFPILHQEIKLSADVGKFLGIKSEATGQSVSIDTIKLQVQEILSNEQSINQHSVAECLEKIYEYLNTECEDTIKAAKVAKEFSQESFILVEERQKRRLVSSSVCAFEPQLTAFPYMNKVSMKYERLFRQIGVADYFSCDNLLESMSMIKEESRGMVLDETTLNIVKHTLDELCTQMTQEGKGIDDLVMETAIMIPDTRGVLMPVESLCYDETESVHPKLQFPLINGRIGTNVAITLGVKQLHEHVLEERSRSIAYDSGTKLVDEIHSLLEDYPCGSQILMELMQQADDAGATEIHFKLDPEKHGAKTVFSDQWNAMQGPSLCVENDAKLDKDSLAGLFLIGNTENSSNRFGVGLQSVYRLTDTPTVLAMRDDGTETLCAYDPTCQYIRGTSPQEPAMMYEDVPLLRQFFPDVFGCYPERDMMSLKATQFRFPLRPNETAQDSPICQSPGNCSEVEGMLNDLVRTGFRSLLFMTSLRKISVTMYDKKEKRFKTQLITAIIKGSESKIREFRKHLLLQKENADDGECAFDRVSYAVSLYKSSSQSEEWSVVQQCGLEKGCKGFLTHQYKPLQRLPVGGVAKLEGKNLSMGSGTKLDNLRNKGKIATSSKATCQSSHINLLFPSYQKTTLPVQVFGNLYTGRSSQGEGWNECITEIIANAYLDMIKSSIKMLSLPNNFRHGVSADRVSNHCLNMVEEYFTVFPVDQSAPIALPIVKRFYELLAKEPVLPEQLSPPCTKWVTPSEACFVQEHQKADDIHFNLIMGANLCGLKVVNCPESVQKMIKKSTCFEMVYLSPEVLLGFLKDHRKCNYKPLSDLVESRKTTQNYQQYQHSGCDILKPAVRVVSEMIEFCKTAKTPFGEQLDQVPLLVTSDGKLRTFNKKCPVYKGPDIEVLQPRSDKFLHPDYISLFQDVKSLVFKELDIKGFCAEFKNNCSKHAQGEIIPFEESSPTYPQDSIESIWEVIDRIVKDEDLKQWAGDLSIWLTRGVDGKCLYPINKMDHVFQKEVMDENAKTLIKELHQEVRNSTIPVSEYSAQSATDMLASFDQPKSVVHALHQYHQEQKAVAKIFRDKRLLEYFTHERLNLADERDVIKDLPIFETLDGEHVSITGKSTYVIPQAVLMDDMDRWIDRNRGILFLKEKEEIRDLYRYVECKFLDTADVYIKYIFKNLHWLSPDGRKNHMNFVLDSLGQHTKITDAIRNLDCIRNTSNKDSKPSDLYDPEIPLFQQVEQEHLPAEDISSVPTRLETLRKAGMTCTATKEMLETYAKRTVTTNASYKIIFDYIKVCVDAERNSEYLQFLADIPFIPRTESENSYICPDFGSGEAFVALRGSVLNSQSALVWSVAPLIEDLLSQFDEGELASAGVITKPSFEMVANNILQVCEYSNSDQNLSSECRGKLSGLIDTCYNDLSAKLENGEYTEEDKRKLQDMMKDHCCVPVDQAKRFVKPNQTVLDLKPNEEVKPYLYRLPDNLSYSKEFLKLLGLINRPTTETYQKVLRMIHEGYEAYAINDLEDIQAAKRATLQIFKKIKRDRSLDVNDNLWLLCKGNHLCKSQKTIYSNSAGIARWVPENINLIDINLKVNIESILDYFPETYRPKLLTSVIMEEVRYAGDTSTHLADKLRKHLASEMMQDECQRLTRHIMLTSAEQHDSTTVDEQIGIVHQVISKIRIASVGNLETCLKCGFSTIRNWREKMFYGDRGTSMFYIDQSSKETASDLVYMYQGLAHMINDLNKGLFREHIGALMIVLSADPKCMGERLNEMGILPNDSHAT